MTCHNEKEAEERVTGRDVIPGRAGDPIPLANRKSRATGAAKQQAHLNPLFLITGTVCMEEHDCREGTVLFCAPLFLVLLT